MRRSWTKRGVLKIDYDSHNSPRLPLTELLRRAARARVRIVAVAECRSPSGRGWHRWVIVSPRPRTKIEMVALQLLFGSDPLREAYCLNRARRIDRGDVTGYWANDDNWDVLYVAH